MGVEFKPVSKEDAEKLGRLLRANVEESKPLYMDPATTSFVLDEAQVTEDLINAIQSVPCHYATVLSDTLEFSVERWDDPGDYPSGAGAGPLPSEYSAMAEGVLVFDEEPDEELLDSFVPEGFRVITWNRVGLEYYPITVELED